MKYFLIVHEDNWHLAETNYTQNGLEITVSEDQFDYPECYQLNVEKNGLVLKPGVDLVGEKNKRLQATLAAAIDQLRLAIDRHCDAIAYINGFKSMPSAIAYAAHPINQNDDALVKQDKTMAVALMNWNNLVWVDVRNRSTSITSIDQVPSATDAIEQLPAFTPQNVNQ